MPQILIISDSHGKYLNSHRITSNYQIDNYSYSGLQWLNAYNSHLSLFSLIKKEPFSSLLFTTDYLLFLIGTNSVRTHLAPQIIDQIDQIFSFIYSQYPHLNHQKLIVTTCIPCFKITKRFPTVTSLMNNIHHYNYLLFILAHKLNFRYLQLSVPTTWLAPDMMHVGFRHHHEFADIIISYINNLYIYQNLNHHHIKRSPEATYRRNKRRNMKQKLIQRENTLTRELSSCWSYASITLYLKSNGIRYASLSITSNNSLHLRFNNQLHLKYADDVLPLGIFDSKNYIQFFQHHQ